MPVHIEPRNGKYCVVEPSGETVPSGCYPDRADALARLRAINANIGKETMTTQIESVTISNNEDTSEQITSGWVHIDDDHTVPNHEDEIDEKEIDEKFGLEMLETGPTSFSELDEARDEMKADMAIKRVVSDFMALVGNIMRFPSPKGKAKDLKELIKEMDDLIPFEEEEEEEDDEKGVDTDAQQEDTIDTDDAGNMFFIWKDKATGEYRWLGVYSNKFRDDDSPAEILAEEAHVRFIERVEKGEVAYPDLYVWHIPVAIGKADLLAYDDAGFSIVSGTIEEEFATGLMKTSEDLAMSHGMPAQYIRRDDESDNTVITQYVSSEVSVLPRYAAANKMTDFKVLKEEEANMAIIPDNKRQQVSELLGNDLTEKLEAGLALMSDKAVAEGIEFKEESQQGVETDVSETGKKTEDVVDEPETVEEPVAGAEDVAGESVESDAGEEEEPVETGETLEKGELASTLAAIVKAMSEQNEQLASMVEKQSARITALESDAGEQAKSDEERVAELAASTPEASLQALLAAQLAGQAGTVIGNPNARVHGNSKLAKDGPEETPHDEEETKEGYTGLFFKDWK